MGNRVLTIVLAIALAVALMAVAYLLGQRSVAPTAMATAPTAAPPREVIVDRQAVGEDQRPLPQTETAVADPEVAIERKDGKVSIVTPKANAEDKNNWALSQYFAQVHALQVGPPGTSPQGFAQEMLGETLNGNTSGIDALLKQAKDAERKAKDLKPPASAAAYHRKLVELMSDSARMLASERDALVAKDPSQLMSLAASAKTLEQKAHALEAEEKSLLGTGE